MFHVKSSSPLDEEWLDRDLRIMEAAGKQAHRSLAVKTSRETVGRREHEWLVPTFEDARGLKKNLESVDGVAATFREGMSA